MQPFMSKAENAGTEGCPGLEKKTTYLLIETDRAVRSNRHFLFYDIYFLHILHGNGGERVHSPSLTIGSCLKHAAVFVSPRGPGIVLRLRRKS